MAKSESFKKNISRYNLPRQNGGPKMNARKKYPAVAIVGRTNVGKSTLFNRLTKDKGSLVFAREGVTRDYIQKTISWNEKTFNLIDTGGLPLKIPKDGDPILKEIKESVLSIVEKADLVLFVCDAKSGLVNQDREIAKLLHKAKKQVLLLINKSDNVAALQEHEHEFDALGFKEILKISAAHGLGIRELLNAITEKIEFVTGVVEKPSYSITILGKPNVGKSSLLNLVLKKERAIVSEMPGTTREAIAETITLHKEAIRIVDTAGVRRKGRVSDPLEIAMVKSSLDAVRKAEIVIIVVDVTQARLSDQELKLLFYAYEQGKSIILVFNKTDILTEHQKERLEYNLKWYDFFIKKIPVLYISCKMQKNIGRVLKEILKARERRTQKFDETKVTEILKEALIKKPLYHKRELLKLYNVKPVESEDRAPTFLLSVNHPAWFGPTQLGYLENQLRRHFDLLGCPIRLVPKKRADFNVENK
jgi:GTP-binding protein